MNLRSRLQRLERRLPPPHGCLRAIARTPTGETFALMDQDGWMPWEGPLPTGTPLVADYDPRWGEHDLAGRDREELASLYLQLVRLPAPPLTAEDRRDVQRLRRLPDDELRRLYAEAMGRC